MKSIPEPMFTAILARENVFLTKDSQWYVAGFVYFENLLHKFYIDRKEQYSELEWSLSFEDVLAMRRLPTGLRPWIRKQRKALS